MAGVAPGSMWRRHPASEEKSRALTLLRRRSPRKSPIHRPGREKACALPADDRAPSGDAPEPPRPGMAAAAGPGGVRVGMGQERTGSRSLRPWEGVARGEPTTRGRAFEVLAAEPMPPAAMGWPTIDPGGEVRGRGRVLGHDLEGVGLGIGTGRGKKRRQAEGKTREPRRRHNRAGRLEPVKGEIRPAAGCSAATAEGCSGFPGIAMPQWY